VKRPRCLPCIAARSRFLTVLTLLAFMAQLALLAQTALLAGCSGKPPVISRVYARLIYNRDIRTGLTGQTLGVFLVASDPDGMENLSAFYVINDDAQLFWKVDATAWVTSLAEGETWLGTTTLGMPGSAPLPSGQYRVVLQSVGGDTVEDTFTLARQSVSASTPAYPAARIAGGAVRITGSYTRYEIWAYGKDGAFVAAIPAEGKSPAVPVQSIAGASPALADSFTFRIFAWNEKAGYGVLSGPYTSASLPEQ
jgi:hypothetical protein